MDSAHPLPRRTLMTSISWRRLLNSADCGLESPPSKISSEVDDNESKIGDSDVGIIGDCTSGEGETGALLKSGLRAAMP